MKGVKSMIKSADIKRTRKVQQSGYNTYVNIPRDICKMLNFVKGDSIMVTGNQNTGKITIERL